jgi:5,10-methylene-tetrahydrofolate dehydrogenase/methenyl tetrahydrofolate cyclohydrolase
MSDRFSKLILNLKNETLANKNETFMKVVVTGSLGNISKPLAHELLEKGHTVTVISSDREKQKDIEALGAIFVPFAKRLPSPI